MLLVPCIIQVMVFSNHSIVHDFSMLKFSVPLATIPFVLLPIMIFLLSNKSFNIKLKNINGFKVHISVSVLLIFLMAFTFSVNLYS